MKWPPKFRWPWEYLPAGTLGLLKKNKFVPDKVCKHCGLPKFEGKDHDFYNKHNNYSDGRSLNAFGIYDICRCYLPNNSGEKQWYCGHCGTRYEGDEHFCRKCGVLPYDAKPILYVVEAIVPLYIPALTEKMAKQIAHRLLQIQGHDSAYYRFKDVYINHEEGD